MVGERSTPAVFLWALCALLAAMVFMFVLGSGSESELVAFGHTGRWVLLLLFWCFSALLFVGAMRAHRIDRIPVFAIVALALFVLALVSASWSVLPHTTAARAISLGILASAVLSLGYAAVVRPEIVPFALAGVLAGSLAAGLAGLLLLLVDRGAAVQAGGVDFPPRYRGLGENPNTYSMLAAVTLPIALWVLLDGRARWCRVSGGLAAAVLIGSISFSGSRGAYLGAVLGAVVYVSSRPAGRRVVAVPATVGVLGIALLLGLIPQPTAQPTAAQSPSAQATSAQEVPSQPSGSHGPPLPAGISGYNPARLQDEVGRPYVNLGQNTARHLLGSSGRVQAWEGAVSQANERPLLGYGFGTEEKVFVDRFYSFEGSRPENSWIGMYMQLGLAGVLAMLALWASLLPGAWAAVRRRAGTEGAVLVGICAAGLLLTGPQSYFYSVGNVATATVWLAAALLGFTSLTRAGGSRGA